VSVGGRVTLVGRRAAGALGEAAGG
jgi:hypothetical protein